MLHLEFVAEAALKKFRLQLQILDNRRTVYHLVIDRKTCERASEA